MNCFLLLNYFTQALMCIAIWRRLYTKHDLKFGRWFSLI